MQVILQYLAFSVLLVVISTAVDKEDLPGASTCYKVGMTHTNMLENTLFSIVFIIPES